MELPRDSHFDGHAVAFSGICAIVSHPWRKLSQSDMPCMAFVWFILSVY